MNNENTETNSQESFKFLVNFNVLRALLPFVSKDKNRLALTGINLQISAKHIKYTAVDGRRLVCYRGTRACEADVPETSVIVPACLIKNMKKGILHTLSIENDRISLWNESDCFGCSCARILDKYPPTEQVIVKSSGNTDCLSVNPIYIGEFSKALKALGHKHASIQVQPSEGRIGAYLVTTPDNRDFFGIIMPIRYSDDKIVQLPAWAENEPQMNTAAAV